MLGQMGANATKAQNDSIAAEHHQSPPLEFSRFTAPNQKDALAQCGPGQPCADGSCCNSVSTAAIRKRVQLIVNRKANVDSGPIIASPQLRRLASPIATLILCVEWTLSMVISRAP